MYDAYVEFVLTRLFGNQDTFFLNRWKMVPTAVICQCDKVKNSLEGADKIISAQDFLRAYSSLITTRKSEQESTA